MISSSLRSILFPYTTLFRSLCDLHRAEVRAAHRAEVRHLHRVLGQRFVVEVLGGVRVEAEVELVFPADRKSTRLNSSHLGISYAVFCLKKNRNLATEVYLYE